MWLSSSSFNSFSKEIGVAVIFLSSIIFISLNPFFSPPKNSQVCLIVGALPYSLVKCSSAKRILFNCSEI
jgi:hypothetical protein